MAAPVFRRESSLATREIADETLLVPVRGTLASLRQIFVLNPVAAFVWSRIDGVSDLDALVAQVVERFEVTAEQARADLAELVASLEQAGLIVREQPGAPALPHDE